MDETTRKLIDALRDDPSNVARYQALKAHYLSLGDVASAANLIEGWAAREEDAGRASAAYLEAARLVMSLPHEEERLLSLLELALTLNPLAEDARGFLENYYLVRNDLEGLLESLERQREHLARIDCDPSILSELEYRLGELLGERLGRGDEALQRYRAAAEIDPSNIQALYAARNELLRRGEIAPAVELLEREAIAESDPARKLALFLELEQRALHELHDAPLAIRAAQKAIAIAPHDLELRHRLTAMLLERIQRGEAEEREEAMAIQLMLELAAASTNDAALVYARNALRIDPSSSEALSVFEDAARDEASRVELLEHYALYLETAEDEAHGGARRRRFADLLLASGAPDEAAEALAPLIEAGDAEASLKLVTISDAHPELRSAHLPRALGLLADGYLEGDRPDAAAIALERLFLAERDLEARVQIADRLSALAIDTLNDRTLALRILRAWLALDPTDLTPQLRLAPLLLDESAETGLSDELLDILDTLSLDPVDGGRYALDAARLLAESGDAKAAIFRLRDRASFDASCREAMLEIAHAADLEGLLPEEFRPQQEPEEIEAEEIEAEEIVEDDLSELVEEAELIEDEGAELIEDGLGEEELVEEELVEEGQLVEDELVEEAELIDDELVEEELAEEAQLIDGEGAALETSPDDAAPIASANADAAPETLTLDEGDLEIIDGDDALELIEDEDEIFELIDEDEDFQLIDEDQLEPELIEER